MSRVAAGRPSALEVARSFALTLVPIAIGYHVAHYLVFLLVQGQYIIPLLSDPFGRGWNLFGTAGYRVDIALAGARFAWYTAVGAIVTGHVLAVYLAHVRAIVRVRTAARGARHAGAAHRADGALHLRRPLHHRRADRREPHARRAVRGGGRHRRGPSRCPPARRAERPARGRGTRHGCPTEAYLQGAGLRLPRRHQDQRRGHPLCLCVRLPLGHPRPGRERPLRPLHRRCHRAHAPASRGRARRRRSTPRPSRSGWAMSTSCARSSRSRSTCACHRRSPNGAPSWRRRGARCPGTSSL